MNFDRILVRGAQEHNLKNLDLEIFRGKITVITGVSGSGKSSVAFDTILAESQRRFFYTLSHYSRQFLDIGSRPKVRSVSGLSPAISLAQNETAPSRRATLGSLTDLSELIAVMLARFGDQRCPKHDLPTSAMDKDAIVASIAAAAKGRTICLVVSVAESKKGVFRSQLTSFASKGYQKAWIDGRVKSLEPLPELEREEKHTIKVIIDVLKVKDSGHERLIRSIDAVLELGGGFGEWAICQESGEWKVEDLNVFSIKGGCPVCGHSWPKLDSRYFNPNSLGRCEDCDGYGVPHAQEYTDGADGFDANDTIAEARCGACLGTGVQNDAKSIRIGEFGIHELLSMPLTELFECLQGLLRQKKYKENPAFVRVLEEAKSGLDKLLVMKLGYLSLARRVRSLSGGEAQRVKLAGILSENLRGILYVLDEPSQGLHHTELNTVIESLKLLRNDGNTIIVVDHDETVMKSADFIVDLGPGGGVFGGEIVAAFTPDEAEKFKKFSKTAAWLVKPKKVMGTKRRSGQFTKFLEIESPRLNNLMMDCVRFPLNAMTVVTGVSGAGKSSLVLGVLFENIVRCMQATKQKCQPIFCSKFRGWESLTTVQLIDRRPVAKSSVSMPATYLDIMSDLRDLYAKLPDAQVAGIVAKSFSLHLDGGRCPECKGRGEINLSMRFLADARVECPVCRGYRFRPHIQDIKYSGLNMTEVLSLSLDEAITHFANHRRIVNKLLPAQKLGLGYLKLGQPSASLSGGEAQRLKMVPFFTKKMGSGTVLILDEPTTGLHFEDVERLVVMLRQLVDDGATLVVVEHSEELRSFADWQIDIGPGSATNGGRLIFEGAPK